MAEDERTALAIENDQGLCRSLSTPPTSEELEAEHPARLADAVRRWLQAERIERGRTFCTGSLLVDSFRWYAQQRGWLHACASARAIGERLHGEGFRRARDHWSRGYFVAKRTARQLGE